MIKIAKNITSNNPMLDEGEENFEKYFQENLSKQIQCDFFYLINFDITFP